MASEPHPVEHTLRVRAALRTSLDDFLDAPLSEAREADLIARIHSYRDAVRANVLTLPRATYRNT